MDAIKTTFIIQCLSDYMISVMASMRTAAKREGVGVTNEAIESLSYEVLQRGAGAFANLSFENVLRFVDMGVGRGHPLGGLKAVTVELQSRKEKGLAQVKGRKPKKIYSKIAYGKLTWLQNKLLYGYTEETIAMIKATMQPLNP
jgi:hypothetical protein